MKRSDAAGFWSCQTVGLSNGPSPGSAAMPKARDFEDRPQPSRLSFASPQSASCSGGLTANASVIITIFPEGSKTSALSPTASEENMLRDVSRNRGTDAVNFALKELAGRGTDLSGLTKVQQLDLVNEVLKSKGKKITVALSTLYRTLASRENAIK